jgi:hypothetical protein
MKEKMNLLKEFQSYKNVTVKQSFESPECNEYEFFDADARKVCYVVEYFNNPITNEVLENTVYELYYDNENESANYADDDFLSSAEFDDVEFLLSAVCELI